MTSKNNKNNSDSDCGPRNSDHKVGRKKIAKNLDEIITEHQAMTVTEAEDLVNRTGGCSCFLYPPCHFCLEYDWENDPLDKL